MRQECWKIVFLFMCTFVLGVFCTSPYFIPCKPSPCGPYSYCEDQEDGFSVKCSCEEGCVGSPPACRPECLDNTECPQHQACMWRRCKNPCPESCGVNARCQVKKHIITCSCPQGFSGDPFSICNLEPTPEIILDKDKNNVVAKFNESLKRQCRVTNLGSYWHIEALQWRQVKPDGDHVVSRCLKNCSLQLDTILKDSDDNTYFYCEAKLQNNKVLTSDFVYIHITNKPGDSDEENNNENDSSTTTIWISVGVLGIVFGAALTTGVIYRKLSRSTTDSAQPPEELEYSYVPIEMRSLYEARALLASNKKLGPAAFVPALPPREGDYDVTSSL